jgi:hypothetical protein
MELTTTRLLFIAIIFINIIGLVLQAFYVHPNGSDNILILSIFALGQSFANAVLAGIISVVQFVAKARVQKDKLKTMINAFLLSMALSGLLAIGYCFIGVPIASKSKASNVLS